MEKYRRGRICLQWIPQNWEVRGFAKTFRNWKNWSGSKPTVWSNVWNDWKLTKSAQITHSPEGVFSELAVAPRSRSKISHDFEMETMRYTQKVGGFCARFVTFSIPQQWTLSVFCTCSFRSQKHTLFYATSVQVRDVFIGLFTVLLSEISNARFFLYFCQKFEWILEIFARPTHWASSLFLSRILRHSALTRKSASPVRLTTKKKLFSKVCVGSSPGLSPVDRMSWLHCHGVRGMQRSA
jgi:hypothetical protein